MSCPGIVVLVLPGIVVLPGADRVSSEVFQTLHLAVVTRLLPQILRGDEALMARAPPKETRAAKAARLRD